MKICLVSSSFYPAIYYGGPISATWDLSNKLAAKDIDMYISTTNANGKSRLDVETNKFIYQKDRFFVKYYHEQFVNRFSLAFICGVWADIRQSDIVYIQYIFHYTVLFALFYSILQRKTIIICPRGSLSIFTLSNKLRFIKSIWLRLFVKPFCNSVRWQASSYLEKDDIKRSFPEARVEIINDGVDFMSFQQFEKYNRKELLIKYTGINFPDISVVLFSMGRLHSIKGFDILIDSFSLFVKDNINAKLIIAGGDDGVEERLKQQIIDLDLCNSVFMIGPIEFEDKKVLLNNCDYFALASRFESFGIVIAEALSCGKPVILSNRTPWIDLVKNKCGILVENDKNSFYNSFVQFTNKEYNSKEIKDYVEANYDWSIIANRFLLLFKNK
tara:strand:- start:8612 stop:9769 length:1158 start_codon:yes stop_codon:yes gene_type:complete